MRYVVEGTWTGYVSRQCRVVHREVVTARRASRLRRLHKIIYTDGTALIVDVREADYRERVQEKHQYDDLLLEAERSGLNVFCVGVDDKRPA